VVDWRRPDHAGLDIIEKDYALIMLSLSYHLPAARRRGKIKPWECLTIEAESVALATVHQIS
jgi:hypothetical protein